MGSSAGSDSGGGGGRTDAQSQYGGTTGYDSSANQSGREQSYGGRDTGSDYGQFDRAVSQAANNPPSAPSGGDGGNNTVDPGFQEALRQQAIQQLALGDPDPQVDVSPEDRDSITSFLDNYAANGGGGVEQAFINNAISQLPYAMTGTTPQDSMVNQYFSNLGTSGSGLSSDLQTSYNNAKNNISSILGTNQQFGYSAQPYGLLSSTNMADNPFNIPYLQQRGLI